MNVKIHPSWKAVLGDEFEKPYFKELVKFVKLEYQSKEIFPPAASILKAFEACPFDQVKVVILGQDPYHGPGQANGLCFSVSDGVRRPPSLQNIFKEIESDMGYTAKGDRIRHFAPPRDKSADPPLVSGNLERWATQGVLLLNATLTVEAGRAGSHQRKGWEQFTDRVVKELSEKREGLVFMLWGRYAQEKGVTINEQKHLVLRAPHPSPLSAYSGFLGCRHFSQTNRYLETRGLKPIDWK